MIPQTDLERAIARWKARRAGQAVPEGYEAVDPGYVNEGISASESGVIALSDDEMLDQDR